MQILEVHSLLGSILLGIALAMLCQRLPSQTSSVELYVLQPIAPISTENVKVAPVTVDGYAGVSLGGNMVNKLLIVAWPHGDTIVSSFRQAT